MHKGLSFSRKRRRKRTRVWVLLWLAAISIGMGGIFLALELKSMAASEEWDVEVVVETNIWGDEATPGEAETAQAKEIPVETAPTGAALGETISSEATASEAESEAPAVPEQKTMYLTFDDGPSEENTSAVLDILKARNIKATFFVVGENVRRHPEVARRIAAEGHTIGIHCNRHEYKELYQSTESYLKDFEEAYQAVLETTGVEVRLFRFPGGSVNAYNRNVYQNIIDEMTARGFIYFDWNASLEDSIRKSQPEELIKNAVDSTLGRKKIILLAHDIVHNTALCLNDLLDQFPEYQMEPLTPEVEPIRFHP